MPVPDDPRGSALLPSYERTESGSMTLLFATLLYAATALFVVGLLAKIKQYATTPAPLKIPTTPAPTTQAGVVVRMLKELVLFQSLFRASIWTWIFGWMFHFAMFLVVLRHLRYFIDPVWWWVGFLQPFGKYASIAMLFGLVGLLVRRIFVDRVRYISAPSDFLMLLLLLGIAGSGMLMTFVSHVDIISLKLFLRDVLSLQVGAQMHAIPGDPILLAHLAMIIILLAIFPFSKLLHAPGIFFSPTRNQVDNPREQRHIVDWARKLESSE